MKYTDIKIVETQMLTESGSTRIRVGDTVYEVGNDLIRSRGSYSIFSGASAQQYAAANGLVVPPIEVIQQVYRQARKLKMPARPNNPTDTDAVAHTQDIFRENNLSSFPTGLVAGHKKEIVASEGGRTRIYGGWNGSGIIQRDSSVHGANYVDYSQGMRTCRIVSGPQAGETGSNAAPAENVDQPLNTSGISEQDVAVLDRDGDGVVTRGDYNHAMSYGQGEDLGTLSAISAGEGIAGLFGMLADLMAQAERGQPSVNELRTAANRVRERQAVEDTTIDTAGLSNTGELRTGGAAERSLAEYARSRWQNRNNTELWIAQLCAQCAAETDDFRLIEEQGSNSYFQRYEGRRDLGNTQPGDGARFKGRGWIQLTGRANYTSASRALGIDLVNNPQQAATPDVANRTAVWYFETRVMNRVTDPTDIRTITRLINGGYNGWNRRVAEFNERLDALRSTTQTAGEPSTGGNRA